MCCHALHVCSGDPSQVLMLLQQELSQPIHRYFHKNETKGYLAVGRGESGQCYDHSIDRRI